MSAWRASEIGTTWTPTRLRDSTNQRWSPGSSTVSIGAVIVWPTMSRATIVGTSMAP